MSFAFSRFGREGGNHLAREFVRRAHYFFRLWLDGGDGFKYEQQHVDAYKEEPTYSAWAAGLPEEQAWAKRRVEGIRRLAPRLGVAV